MLTMKCYLETVRYLFDIVKIQVLKNPRLGRWSTASAAAVMRSGQGGPRGETGLHRLVSESITLRAGYRYDFLGLDTTLPDTV